VVRGQQRVRPGGRQRGEDGQPERYADLEGCGDQRAGQACLVRRDATSTPRATLTRRFTALTGQPPMTYLTAWRMCLAARRLRDGDTTVRHIAHDLGYDSEFAFARAFKRATGSAPGHYRKLTQTTG
jgi:transcriptional regulator GlxA family with amidase domain